MSEKQISKRFFHIDLFRFFAILAVTLYHVFRGSSYYFMGLPISKILSEGYLGVDLFFFISGYCMLSSLKSLIKDQSSLNLMQKIKIFYKKRLLRIIPPYYASIIIWNILVRNGVAVKDVGIFSNLTHFLFIHNFFDKTFFSISGVFWSLAVEAQFYLIVPFIFLYLRKRKSLTLAASAIIAILWIYLTPNTYVYKWSLISFLPIFIAGLIGAMKQDLILSKKNIYSYLIFLTATIALLLSLKIKGYVSEQSFIIYRNLMGICLGGLMLLSKNIISSKPYKLKKLIAIFAKYSYSIYLYNYIFYSFRQLPLLHKIYSTNDLTFKIICVCLVFIIGLIFGYLIENILYRNYKKILSLITSTVSRPA